MLSPINLPLVKTGYALGKRFIGSFILIVFFALFAQVAFASFISKTSQATRADLLGTVNFFATATQAIPDTTTIPFAQNPISLVAHGTLLDAGGKPVAPDLEFIQTAQNYYVTDLSRQLSADKKAPPAEKVQAAIAGLVDDSILAKALYIDWLIEQVRPVNRANLSNINSALRNRYLFDLTRIQDQNGPLGLAPWVLDKLKEEGVVVFQKTTAGGGDYIKECQAAGVPVPPPIFGPGWNFQAEIAEEFISWGSTSDLWRYTSTSPAGVCLALPRYASGSDQASLFGVICLGTDTSKACFWDNPKGKSFTKGVPVDISQFKGGFDLVANGQGVCSDCHSGENPFVVHPDMTPFSGLTPSLKPGSWYQPLVAPSWPQNPGPTGVLNGVASNQQCDSCHNQGYAGRFPDVSLALPGYCSAVLKNALDISFPGSSPYPGTMPPAGSPPRAEYSGHINRLLKACDNYPSVGEEVDVDFPDDPNLISPPQVIDPLFACATLVSVKGAIYNAKVTLFINGAAVGSLVAHNTQQETFAVPDLVVGDKVSVLQEFAGVTSAMSAEVVVKDHMVEFPTGLPAPSIDPDLIYECAETIAVRHVPGATITVYSNGGSPVSVGTSTGWTAVWPGIRPFTVGQDFVAEIKLCKDVSPKSTKAAAVAAPTSLPAPKFKPALIYPGQQLVTLENLINGAFTTVNEVGTGDLFTFTTPVSWFPDADVATPLGRPLASGDVLTAQQRLCTKGDIGETPPVGKCEELPAPKIQQPTGGDNYVVVTESVPGARIHIYDNAGIELGDGSGTVITLNRLLVAGEFVTAVQQLEKCTSSKGYRIQVGKRRR